jgi:guanine nucleotide-binding protein subunit alpha
MRVIHAGGFNRTERKQWRAIIFNNLVSAFQTIFAAMQEQETEFEDDDNIVCWPPTPQSPTSADHVR